ncbi:TRAP transporter substrate-binding protein [Robbsia andropogonis]|nr:TRAP transporter substrate-binding protein [Robbsia andropogonis]MCP1117895.1 TRAP transporter substrate-binding protein [Robbsia andropogonis]MCP1127359.1 TRAP transporter substrate-binding protein [Robbsia andropogonis]
MSFHQSSKLRLLRLMCTAAFVSANVSIVSPVVAAQTLRLAHASVPGSLIDQAIQRFAAEVKDSTHGSLIIKDFPSEQLGDEVAIADGVGNGSIDIGLGGAVDAIDPRLNALSLPFLFSNATQVHHYLDSAAGKTFLSIGAPRGYQMLGALDSGFRQFANTKRPIYKPADMVGLKIRTPANPVILATIKQLGALAQSLPLGTVYTSLQSGVVDGAEPELRDYSDEKWYEVAKYVSMSNYVWTANYWYMNKDKYDALPAADRAALDKAVIDTTAWYRAQLEQSYQKLDATLKAKGVKFNDVDTAAFQKAVLPIYAQFSKTWGSALISTLQHDANGK